VEFYLNKGFSTDQVTTLCSTSSTPTRKENPSDLNTQQHTPTAINENELFLKQPKKFEKGYWQTIGHILLIFLPLSQA